MNSRELDLETVENFDVLGRDDDYDGIVDECDGFLPSVARALLRERMRTFMPNPVVVDELDKPSPPRRCYRRAA